MSEDKQQVTLPEAMQAFLDGKRVIVDWGDGQPVTVQKDQWCELNVNHLQRGKWFIIQ